MKLRYLLILLGALAGCDATASKATGPDLNCVLYQDSSSTGSKASPASVGDTVQNCTKTKDSHDSDSHDVP